MKFPLTIFTACWTSFLFIQAAQNVRAENTNPLPDKIDFNEHVQPILSEYCYHCHGPDSGTREPKAEPYRLDIGQDALAARGNGKPLIIPGDPKNSEVVKRMHLKDPNEIMPPPESHKEMKPHEIAILEKWIEQGAEYKAHWSFLKPEKAALPKTEDPAWSNNPIDAFVYEKLASKGLKPNPEEDPRRLFRRLSFDLRGLPPTPAETDAFVASFEANPDAAMLSAAEMMLASDAYAEHMARHWLDAARYADTHGIHIDNKRNIWPYRDWVINAFKQNIPYDQFTIEQIGGDLLPNRTIEQQTATGFNRCLPTTGEGGAIPEEYESIYATDRVSTTSAVWLGLTTGCAACHDHKFDPVSTKEFYEMTAFFRNNEMYAMDNNRADHAPSIVLPNKDDLPRWQELAKQISEIDGKLRARYDANKPAFEQWFAGNKDIALPKPYFHANLTDKPETIAYTLKGEKKSTTASKLDEARDKVSKTPGYFFNEYAEVTFDSLDSKGSLKGFTLAANMQIGRSYSDKIMHGPVLSIVDDIGKGIVISSNNHKLAFSFYQNSETPEFTIETTEALPQEQWHHVTFHYTKAAKLTDAFKIYINGSTIPYSVVKDSNKIDLSYNGRLYFANYLDKKLKDAGVGLQDLRIYHSALSEEIIRQFPSKGVLSAVTNSEILDLYPKAKESMNELHASAFDAETATLNLARNVIVNEQIAITNRSPRTLVMEETIYKEPTAHILVRGSYQNKSEQVGAGVPAVLPPLPAGQKKDRLALGKWLVDKENPLSPRVTVNRYWYYFFGKGIVETTEDFGIMGARPTNRKMLDWLAVDLLEHNWNLHQTIKTIVTSKTYRQSASISAEKLEKDPDNTLLSRGPRYRMDAEQIRDMALAVSDLLSNKIGGDPVNPYQPEGVWESVAMAESNTRFYKQDNGEKLYRRSIYSFWKRSAPPASMEILNAPSREVFCVRRDRTNTPLQAFVTLNDTQFVEASRKIAEHAIKTQASSNDRINFLFQRFLSRSAKPEEQSLLEKSQQELASLFTSKPNDAKELINVGSTKSDASIDSIELASWTMIASQILNLDETLNK